MLDSIKNALGIGKVPEAPTNPRAKPTSKVGKAPLTPLEFDVAELYSGPAGDVQPATAGATGLDEKLRQAYFWIINHAVISPFYDISYEETPPSQYKLGDTNCPVILPTGQSYSSFVLLPLLTLALRRKCLLIGGPGRGKTQTAILMGILSGYSLKEVRRGIQHGQPQMTIADLLGNPLPADLVGARSMDQITIAWRKWLGMRVKIIDEYNRIPTRTQSALLTLMADNYAEILDQVFECPESAWYLTANDDAGGGTYQVIEALRDRIDVVVRALHFNTRFLGDLLVRIEQKVKPEDIVPPQIIFTEAELDAMQKQILKVRIPDPLRRRLEFFASQFEFLEGGAVMLEYRTKDNAACSGGDVKLIINQETGKDRVREIGMQTVNGLSVRALMTAMAFMKGMAFFHGEDEVTLEDMRQMLPFVLHDKLRPNLDARFFEEPGNASLRYDRIGWIRRLFDQACAEYDRLNLDHDDPVGTLQQELDRGLDGVPETEVRTRLARIEQILGGYQRGKKFHAHLYDDVLILKYMHQRYTNYLRWLLTKS